MASVWFDGIEDLTQLTTDLGEAARDVLPAVRGALQKTCADIKADAQVYAPVRNGDLRKSIGFETRVTARGVVGEVGPTVEYGAYVEYGTSRMSPQPYMTPAYDRHAPVFEAVIADIAARAAGGTS